MNTTLFPDDILFTQRILKAEGMYRGELDGIWGPLTEEGATAFNRKSLAIAEQRGCFDLRSEGNIATLSLDTQQQARQFMSRVQLAMTKSNSPGKSSTGPINVKIISGTRSYAEQNKLFRQGRYHNPGPVITHVRGGSSAHNFGIAWDIGIFSESRGYISEWPLYDVVAKAGLNDALEWGGDWTSFVDKPHYHLKMTTPIYLVRKQFEAGELGLQPA